MLTSYVRPQIITWMYRLSSLWPLCRSGRCGRTASLSPSSMPRNLYRVVLRRRTDSRRSAHYMKDLKLRPCAERWNWSFRALHKCTGNLEMLINMVIRIPAESRHFHHSFNSQQPKSYMIREKMLQTFQWGQYCEYLFSFRGEIAVDWWCKQSSANHVCHNAAINGRFLCFQDPGNRSKTVAIPSNCHYKASVHPLGSWQIFRLSFNGDSGHFPDAKVCPGPVIDQSTAGRCNACLPSKLILQVHHTPPS